MKIDKEEKLDKIFKEGLENPTWNANFREDDWDAMDAMLGKDKKRTGIIFWLPIIGSVAAMLLVALVWFLIKHDNGPVLATKPVKQPVNNSDTRSITATSAQRQQIALLKQDTVSNKVSTGTSPSQQVAAVKPNTMDAVNNKTRLGGANNTVNNHNVKAPVNAATQYITNQTANGRLKGNIASSNHTNDLSIKPGMGDNVLAMNTTDLLVASNAAFDRPALNSGLSANTLPASNKSQIVAAPQKYPKTIKKLGTNRPQYAITVLASPDINGVNSFQNAQVGENVGLLFSVGLSKRFTVSTGASYSKKPYMANFSDYHTNYNFKTDPENVTADCRVLDIPINVDYMVYNKARNKFSIGSGLSSYIMLRENYHYNYSSPYTYGPSDYDIANKNQHFLGVLNLDASYSRKLNSKFSLNVEPYLKIPLTNIGASQVRLQSTGLAVGLTWNINSPPK